MTDNYQRPVGRWTDADDAELRRLWAAGMSTIEIGMQMNRSKNSIVGRAHRLQLAGRPSPILPRKVKRPRDPAAPVVVPFKPKRAPSAFARLVPPTARPAPAPVEVRIDPRRGCQFIAGEPSADDACKCRAPVREGSAYCPDHHRRCWSVPPPPVKRGDDVAPLFDPRRRA